MNNDLKTFFDVQLADQNKKRKILAWILVWPLFIIVIGWTSYRFVTASDDKEYYMIKKDYNSSTGQYASQELDTVKYNEAIQMKRGRIVTQGCILLFFPLMFGSLVFGMSAMMKKKFITLMNAVENKKITSVYPVEIHSTLGGATVAKAKQLVIKTEDKKEYKIFVSDKQFETVYGSLLMVRSQYR